MDADGGGTCGAGVKARGGTGRVAIVLATLICLAAALFAGLAACPAMAGDAGDVAIKVDGAFAQEYFIHVLAQVTNNRAKTIDEIRVDCEAFDPKSASVGTGFQLINGLDPSRSTVADILIDRPASLPTGDVRTECRVTSAR